MIAVTPATIYNWWQRWQNNGIEGLANRAKSGRPSKADAAYVALLEQTLDVSPIYHKSYAALAALSLFQKRLQVIWLPKYSPYLNPIERFWLQLKNQASANQLHLDLVALQKVIAKTMDNQNSPGHPDRLELQDYFHLIA
jgi:hypothetical protein